MRRLLRYLRFAALGSLFPALSLSAVVRVAVLAPAQLAPEARHGLISLEGSLRARGFTVVSAGPADYFVLAGTASAPGEAGTALRPAPAARPEALVMRHVRHLGKPAVVLYGSDARGLMYAALDAAERVSRSTGASPFEHVRDVEEAPRIAERAISIYTMHRGLFERRLRDPECWKRYFDLLARSRLNGLVVIFGYENGGFMAPPYPYFFDTPGFASVRLVGITAEEQRRNTEAFRSLIRIAHERGVAVTAAIWDHIYRGGVQGGGIPGASERAGREVPGLVAGLEESNLVPYTKAALRRFLEVFPDVDAIQFRMHGESGLKRSEMESFWHDIFTTMRALRPGLRVDLRAKDLPDSIIEDALAQGLRARVSTKYWMEQMGLPFHPTHVNRQNQQDRRHGYADLLRYPQRYKVHWQLWSGGTARLLLWADPSYVRRFGENVHVYGGDSFEVNEPLATWMLGEAHDTPIKPVLDPRYRSFDYEFERYWHFFQLWGRVSYNPDTPTEVWTREFERRFGAAGRHAMEALHLASAVLPRIVAAAYRYELFPTTRGWAEMMRQGDLPRYAELEGSDIEQFLSPRDAARGILEGSATSRRHPDETSRFLGRLSDQIFEHARQAEAAAGKPGGELAATLADARILAGLARYHAERLRAAVSYNLYKMTGDLPSFDEALAGEKRAVAAWERIVAAAGDVYSEDLPFGVHRVGFPRHWKEELAALRRGLDALESERRSAGTRAGGARVPVRPAAAADREPPSVRIEPCAEARPGEDCRVVVRAEDASGVKSVRLRYRHMTQFEDYETAEMKLDPATGRYSAGIPGSFITRKWDLMFFVEALDVHGNGRNYPDLETDAPYVVVGVKR
jgi:hypothetical protein